MSFCGASVRIPRCKYAFAALIDQGGVSGSGAERSGGVEFFLLEGVEYRRTDGTGIFHWYSKIHLTSSPGVSGAGNWMPVGATMFALKTVFTEGRRGSGLHPAGHFRAQITSVRLDPTPAPVP